jgi:HD superfamily phosphohydrolase
MAEYKRIRTVLYDDQRITRAELELLHTQMFQRLYGLHQLGLTDRVFIDASHSRLHHVVGVLEQVNKLVAAIVRNLKRAPTTEQLRFGKQAVSAREFAHSVEAALPIARLIGFLHDLTHAPYGHTVEDEIGLIVSKHDDPPRQADAFYRLLCQLVGWLATELSPAIRVAIIPEPLRAFLEDPELEELPQVDEVAQVASKILSLDSSVTQPFWRVRPDEVLTLLVNLHVAMTALLHLELLHTTRPEEKHIPISAGYDFQRLIEGVLARVGAMPLLDAIRFTPQRDAYLLDIVGNTVCADILDYAKRDAHYANLKLDYDADRIAEGFTLASWDPAEYKPDKKANCERRCPNGLEDPFAGRSIRTAISLFSHKLRTDVPGELMNLLNVRFYLYERAIYHPTKTAAGAMLGTALQLLWWHGATTTSNDDVMPGWLRFVGDAVFINVVYRAAKIVQATLAEPRPALTLVSDANRLDRTVSAEHSVAMHIIATNAGRDVTDVRDDVDAAIFLLARLNARRYFRPVFRALPDVATPTLDLSASDMADLFKQPSVRFSAEREIESKAKLPRGSIVIHCPRLNTAEKIANALLLMPEVRVDGRAITKALVKKLRHIGSMTPIFKAHEKAITAVEEMYESMWRLAVYVAPEYFDRWEEIAAICGAALYRALDRDQQNPGESLQNDVTLEQEIRLRFAESAAEIDARAGAGQKRDNTTTIAQLTEALHSMIASANPAAAQGIEEPLLRARLTDLVEELAADAQSPLKIRMKALFDAAKPHLGRALDVDAKRELEKRLGGQIVSAADADFVDLLRKVKSIAEPVPAGVPAAARSRRQAIDKFALYVTQSLPSAQSKSR